MIDSFVDINRKLDILYMVDSEKSTFRFWSWQLSH